jgi:hypothetical protein
MPNWIDQLNHDADWAKTMLLQQGEVRPVFVLHCDGIIKIISAEWSSTILKMIIMKLVAMQAALSYADAISFMAEAWQVVLKRRPGESQAAYNRRATSTRPNDATDREEVLTVSIVYREDGEKKHGFRSMKIMRNSAGKITDAPEYPEDQNSLSVEGNLFDMLLIDKLTPNQHVVIQQAFDALKEMTGYTEITQHIHAPGHA